MVTLATLLRIGAVLHIGFLVAGGSLPRVLDWRRALTQVDGLTRRLMWTYWMFIGMTIVGMGLLVGVFAEQLADGSALSRTLCGLMAGFWLLRLVLGRTLPIKPHLTSTPRVVGYVVLNAFFLYLVIVYLTAALS